jgi:LPS export ABC transporter permease LptF/LPS export ABC transporter permease LptG
MAPRMRILDRYIAREVLLHALLGLAVFTFVLFVPQLVRLMELIVRHPAGLGDVARLFACSLPGVLTFTLPMAALVGVLIGLGRLSADSEIVALNASGIGLRRLLVPIGFLAIGAGLLTLVITLWLGPASLRMFHVLEERLRASQASFAVQPRVFDERFPRLVLYVQDVEATASRWRGVLLAETDAATGSHLTLAEEAIVIAGREQGKIELHLGKGSTHEYDPRQPERYAVTTFGASDLPIEVEPPARPHSLELSEAERPARDLLAAHGLGWRDARVELHRRLAFPAACLVFALLGVPVGVRPRRGGRSAGFVLTLLLICGYYLLFVAGVHMAEQGPLPPFVGVWGANLLTALAALLLVRRIEHVRGEGRLTRWIISLRPRRSKEQAAGVIAIARDGGGAARPGASSLAARAKAGQAIGFPLLIDLYILRTFFLHFLLMLAGFLVLFDAFTLFDLLQDISRHHAGILTVANYFRYLLPLMLYQLAPLAALVATLVTLGVMAKSNEVTAFKASGVSMYRLALPLLLATVALSAGMFLLDDTYLPYANQKQDALRNQIKGRPAQTFYQPTHQWIFGEAYRVYNYELFDPDHDLFGGLSVFELDPETFQMRRRVFAERARWEPSLNGWVLEHGWVRDFSAGMVSHYAPFRVTSLSELAEPPSYFKREVLPSSQMNWRQLRQYIGELRQAGFETSRLSVQWHKKFAFPLIAAIIVFLAVPFAFLVGTRGAIGGLALAVGIGLVYWTASDLFEAMGAVGQLPPLLAGWAPDVIFAFLGTYFFLKMPT